MICSESQQSRALLRMAEESSGGEVKRLYSVHALSKGLRHGGLGLTFTS